MTKEQKQYKLLIKADLNIVHEFWDHKDKSMRLQAAYHMQQAVEKSIKLMADIAGINLWGHDISDLIGSCDKNGIGQGIPDLIREKAFVITEWEADCRYYPTKAVRKDTIKKVYDVTVEWLNKIR